MSYLIAFQDVGRDKRAWSMAYPFAKIDADKVEALVERELRRKGVLMSRDIGACLHDEHGGTVYVGMGRVVGRFSITPTRNGGRDDA